MLSIDNIIFLWQNLLLERKIFLVSKSKNALTKVSMALISLMFPIKWLHVFIPVLPEKLQLFSDAPVPLLIGICYDFVLKDVPEDIIVVDIDTNTILQNDEKIENEPKKLMQTLRKRLDKFNKKFNNPGDKYIITHLDDLFTSNNVYAEKDVFNIDYSEIKDIFFEFFINLFKKYEEYVFCFGKLNSKTVFNSVTSKEIQFDRDLFLVDHESNIVLRLFN